ncbi:MAG: pilus assembly protein N-terminal domain-containing protein [Candidatus Eisenbacteria bacterium]
MNCSSRTSGVWRRNLAVWVLFSLAVLAFFTGSLYAAKNVRDLMVPLGHTEILDFPSPINRISIANPEIADATVTSPRQLIVNGLMIGTTSLIVWDEDEDYTYYELIVHSDNIYNQVMLQVRFVEVDRTAFLEFGTDFFIENINVDGDRMDIGSYGGKAVRPWHPDKDIEPSLGLSDNVDFFLAIPTRDFTAVISALEQEGMLSTLARPNLIALSGADASFLAGGEIPVPIISGTSNQVTIAYKEYGIKLNFTPTVLDSELVNIKVKTEVSTLDYENGVVLSGFAIPALISNKAHTTVEMRDGETFIIGGMILNEVARGVSRIPILGHIPVLGYLFSSHRYQNKETELMILISPHIVQAMRPEEVPEIDMNMED